VSYVVGNAFAGGGVYQCSWRDSSLKGRMLGIQVWVSAVMLDGIFVK